MADFEHLLKSYNVGDLLDEMASADPPAYLRRCFAEGISTPSLSWPRVQQLAAAAMVLDAVIDDADYAGLEHELIADWRLHYRVVFFQSRNNALLALRRAREVTPAAPAEAAAELDALIERLGGA